jgi:hypothetical protein
MANVARSSPASLNSGSGVRFPTMQARLKRVDVEAVKEDLKNRTLEQFGYDFARLVYVSSLRDLSSGEYCHHGLANTFSQTAASAALAACHQELFYRLALGSLESLVNQLDRFIQSTRRDYRRTLETWETLETYNVTLPSECDQTAAGLFRSNIKVGMALLKSRRPAQEGKYQSASPRPLLDQ